MYRLRPERMSHTGFTLGGQHGSHAEVSDGAEVEVPVSLVKKSTSSGLGPVPWLRGMSSILQYYTFLPNKADGRNIEQ